MEKMDVDDTVVDLSVGHSYSIGPETSVTEDSRHRRVLRPRTEPRRYTESPDLAMNGNAFAMKSCNGNGDSDSSEGEMPPLLPIKEMTPSEVRQRERNLRKLREELRSEEMKLVLLKKLRQSQQLKENLATVSQVMQSQPLTHPGLPSGLSITPTTVKVPSKTQQPPPPTHPRHSSSGNGSAPKSTSHGIVPPLMRGQPQQTRSSSIHPQINCPPSVPRLPPANLSVPQPSQRTSLPHMNRPPAAKDIPPAVTITPAPPAQPVKQPERPREDIQTPAQRQAAAKLALRKQLEKTLLQIPPPKPPPPEMHFIPNPSNTEFIYLLGLEHVVDFLTREPKSPTPPTPFQCQQCHADFTPVWKWEKQIKNRQNNATFQQHSLGKDPRVICEQCVTSNVKKALKAEHTNRLKTAFVKALQQEQEIEQRLAQVSCNSPSPSPAAPEPSPKAPTPTPSIRPVATPPAPPPPQPTPPPARQSHTSSSHGSSSHASTSQQDKFHQSAAAMQALQQQIFRGLSGAPPAHMLPFSPLFYPYMAMAQAAGANASGGKGATPNLVDLQRATDLHRQYLLDMIPPQSGQSRHNWKT